MVGVCAGTSVNVALGPFVGDRGAAVGVSELGEATAVEAAEAGASRLSHPALDATSARKTKLTATLMADRILGPDRGLPSQ